MYMNKFYNFVTDITKDDPTLAESIITAHKLIFESDDLDEGIVSKLAGTAALAGSLLAPSAMAGEKDINSIAKNTISQMSDEYAENSVDPSFNPKEMRSYKKAMKTYKKLKNKDENKANQYLRILDSQFNKKLGLNIKFM